MESMDSMGMGASMYTPDELGNYMGDSEGNIIYSDDII